MTTGERPRLRDAIYAALGEAQDGVESAGGTDGGDAKQAASPPDPVATSLDQLTSSLALLAAAFDTVVLALNAVRDHYAARAQVDAEWFARYDEAVAERDSLRAAVSEVVVPPRPLAPKPPVPAPTSSTPDDPSTPADPCSHDDAILVETNAGGVWVCPCGENLTT